MSSPAEILKKYWNYDHFRPLQREIIDSVLSGSDTVALLPTGGGKSICYQLPAVMKKGLCLVVSPLIALMQDQVQRLKQAGIQAACLHAGMHFNDVQQTMNNVLHGPFKLLYVSPERLQTDLFKDYLPELNVTLIAVDEAHCISQWGHDFRPDYLKIAALREIFPNAPVLALTATATAHVQQDIISQLQLRTPLLFKNSFRRSNIFYEVRYSEQKNRETIEAASGNECAIIYCRSRKQTELLDEKLRQAGIAATAYHAGMPKEKREAAQKSWMEDATPVIAATTAFGMGIDKAGVRKVIHYDAPESIESYYQEIGRAGRDGKPSHAIALYNSVDISRLKESIALRFPPERYLRQVYQGVVEYLQVAIGTEPDRYYPFDLYDFCKKFDLKPSQGIHALKLLEREDLWTMTDAVYHPATIQFTTERRVLDDIGKAYPNLGYIITGLLRTYGTIFYYPTPVRLSAVAKQLKLPKDHIEQAVMQLQKMELLQYAKPGEEPQLYFHHYRVDSRHLLIDTRRIHTLRMHYERQVEAMIAFLENDLICRERMVLSYFGEKPDEDCGHCDVCSRRKSKLVSSSDLRNDILRYTSTAGKTRIKSIMTMYATHQHELVTAIIRQLLDEGELHLVSGDTVTIKQKE